MARENGRVGADGVRAPGELVLERDPDTGTLNAVVETPKGHRNKFKYDEELRLFTLGSVLPAGAVFPFDFGFFPSTKGGDGDPLDVLVLMDEPAFPGCVVEVRLIGVITAEQTDQEGKRERNDRLIAVAAESHMYRGVRELEDLPDTLVDEIEHFFVSYNQTRGKRFKPLGRHGPERARKLVNEASEKVAA
jgi:inorganic pyrophosphatase